MPPAIETSHPKGMRLRKLSVCARRPGDHARGKPGLGTPGSAFGGAAGTGLFTLSVAASQLKGSGTSLGMKPLLVREISSRRERAPRPLAFAVPVRLFLAGSLVGAMAIYVRARHSACSLRDAIRLP